MSDTHDDLESEIDALYQLPIADFVKARNALAKRVGDKADSKRVRALEKPGAAAWALNQLYGRERELFDQMTAHADEYRVYQRAALGGHGTDIPPVLDQLRRETHNVLLARALLLLEDEGKPASKATARQIATSLETLAAFGSAYSGTSLGRLARDLDPPGIEVLASLSEGLVIPPAPRRAKPVPEAEDEAADTDHEIAAPADDPDDDPDDDDADEDTDLEIDAGVVAAAKRIEQLRARLDQARLRRDAAVELVHKLTADLEASRRVAGEAEEEVARLGEEIARLAD